MSEIRSEKAGQVQPEKKPYGQPELVKHGAVESLTQQTYGGSSCPVTIDLR